MSLISIEILIRLLFWLGFIIGGMVSITTTCIFLVLYENRRKANLISLLKNPEERNLLNAYFFPFKGFKISSLWRSRK